MPRARASPGKAVVSGLFFDVAPGDTARVLSPAERTRGQRQDRLDPPRRIVINEINYNASDDLDTEDWVELYDAESQNVDLSGWAFMDAEGDHTGTSSPEIAPSDFVLVSRDTAAFRLVHPNVGPLFGDMGFGFSGSGERLRLYSDAGELVDDVTYDDEVPWPTEADGEGALLELRDPSDDNAPQSWIASHARGGTPGDANSAAPESAEDAAVLTELLAQNHPIPFTRSTRITYRLKQAGHVRLDVYDVTGRLVQTLADTHQPVAAYDVVWRPASLGDGVYAYRLLVDGALVRLRRAVLVR